MWKKMKERREELYLGMTLRETGINKDRSEERARGTVKDLSAMTAQSWWSTGLNPSQIGTMLEMCVRSKYRYGLAITGVSEEVRKQDDKWEEAAMRTMLKTKTPVAADRGRKLRAL